MSSELSKLQDSFGDYRSVQMDQRWESLKATLRQGAEVKGKVIARVPFGIFLDIGVGFPALIRVTDFTNADLVHYTMEMYPVPGSDTTGIVIGLNDRNRQIDLTQRSAGWHTGAATRGVLCTHLSRFAKGDTIPAVSTRRRPDWRWWACAR